MNMNIKKKELFFDIIYGAVFMLLFGWIWVIEATKGNYLGAIFPAILFWLTVIWCALATYQLHIIRKIESLREEQSNEKNSIN